MKIFGIILFSSSLLLTACGGNNSQNTGSTTDSIIDSAQAAIDSVAAPEVQPDLALATQCLTEIYETGIPQPFTPEFAKLISDANAKAEKEGSEVGFFDLDVLTFSQDPGALKSVDIIDTKGSTVIAEVTGTGYGENGKITVTAVLVDGVYLIDDVNGCKQQAIDFLKQ